MTDDKDRLSELYRSADLPNSPSQLDEAVLSLAAELAPAKVTRLPGWLPLASAASVVGLTVLLAFQTGGPQETNVSAKEEFRMRSEISSDRIAVPQALDLNTDMQSEAMTVEPSASAAAPERRMEQLKTRSNAARIQPLIMEKFLIDTRRDDDGISPQQWLDNITDLLKAGDLSRAVSQFNRFQELNPDFPIPADLEKAFSEAESSLSKP
ncbi:MAG: hypothetical protein ACI9GW_000729 [Halieaceae bacterium]|jgi:hypothetical protein